VREASQGRGIQKRRVSPNWNCRWS
jgi:hypothetical protein